MIGRDYRVPSGRPLQTAKVTRLLLLIVALPLVAADLPGANDPAGMKRYERSEIIGYRAPQFSSLASSGRVALYGIYFDTDKDTIRPDSQPALQEWRNSWPPIRNSSFVVGHTDNQGEAAYNLDLSRRRAAGVVSELTSKYRIASGRRDSFGAGLYAPVASNQTEEGRATNAVSNSSPGNFAVCGVPRGIRTPVTAVKGRCPRPG